MKKLRAAVAVAGATALALGASACGAGNNEDESGSGGDSMVVGTTDKVVSIDPAAAYDNGSLMVQTQVYQYLLNFPEGETEPQPDAAEKCDFDTPTTYTCTIKDGLKFANGNPLTAKSVAHSFQRIVALNDPNGPASLLVNMAKVEAKDDKTVVFTLKSPNDQTFPQVLVTSAGPIVDMSTNSVPGFAPVPRHVGQGAESGTDTGICAPSIACSNETCTSVSRSRPRSGRGVRPPPAAPPKRSDRMSPKPPKPPGRFEGVRPAASSLGGGAYLLLDRPQPTDEQGLREAHRDQRSVHLRGDEPPDGEEIGSLMRVFRQFQGELLRITLPETVWKIASGLLDCGHGWSTVSKNGACWPLFYRRTESRLGADPNFQTVSQDVFSEVRQESSER